MKLHKRLSKPKRNYRYETLMRAVFTMLMILIVLLVIFRPFRASAMTAKSQMRIVGFDYGFIPLVNSDETLLIGCQK
jgi:uncharacterized membrane protein